jgi:hypothetical protein
LLVDGGTGDILSLYLEGQFTFTRGDAVEAATFGSDNQDPADYAPLLRLIGEAVGGVEISDRGDLTIGFEGGAQIEVPPDPMCEAWGLEGLGHLIVHCMPGGELAISDGAKA